MASTLHRLSFATIRCSYRTPARRKRINLTRQIRQFHRTPLYQARGKDEEDEDEDADEVSSSSQNPAGTSSGPFKFALEDLAPEEQTLYKSLPPDQQEEFRLEAKLLHDYYTQPEVAQAMTGDVSKAASEPLMTLEPPPKERFKEGLLALGEDEMEDIGEDPKFEGDDITALGHGELEQHRELREYARIAVWEMPLLHKFAKPFTLPTIEQPLRFRYTTYLGETHPASKKIVCQFSTHDIAKAASLTEAQRIKLVKLVGVRYNPDSDMVKMTCEKFETQAQNKRYLGDLVNTLINEAKDDKDTFEDVPLDFRHHRPKKQWSFPEEWKLTPERREALRLERERRKEIEAERQEMGRLVEGRKVVEESLRMLSTRDESRVLVEQQQGKRKGLRRLR